LAAQEDPRREKKKQGVDNGEGPNPNGVAKIQKGGHHLAQAHARVLMIAVNPKILRTATALAIGARGRITLERVETKAGEATFKALKLRVFSGSKAGLSPDLLGDVKRDAAAADARTASSANTERRRRSLRKAPRANTRRSTHPTQKMKW
jgi:hypothetical protein